ncbi:hypothetical protein [Mobiluncus mulieris]|uniref:hypothetical protein n=1 Tax=Mobiluncus mulieris TaxID=2052 RepID=UPI001B8D50CF|nr:hypothetical protein [Mobiluncus mulieris]
MTSRRLIVPFLGFIAAGLMPFVGVTPALAANAALPPESVGSLTQTQDVVHLTQSQELSVIAEFVSYGVEKNTAQTLVKKYKSGHMLDSLNPDVQPVKIVHRYRGEVVEVLRTYPDGSISVGTSPNLEVVKTKSLLSHTQSTSQLRSVYGCTFTSGGHYGGYWRNCTADENLIVVRMGFTFDYETVNGQGSKITSYGNYFHHIFGGSLSNFRFDRISNTQVRLSADFDVAFKGFPAGWTDWMQVNVDGSSAYTTHN